MNTFETIKPIKNTQEIIAEKIKNNLDEFLQDAEHELSHETQNAIPALTESITESLQTQWNASENALEKVAYNKFKKEFIIGDTSATAGEIISSRHWGKSYAFPDELESSIQGKKLLREATTYHTMDRLTTILNHELATNLALKYESKDLFKSQAFQKIAERTAESAPASEQLGVFAESMMQGTLERIAIDREDLGLMVLPGNAAQDVLEKIDFVISTKTKKRGVGIETADPLYDEKHIGVQFTTNTAKAEYKKDQIEKSKLRGTPMDDIIYVALDQKTLAQAITTWKKAGEPLSGPWTFLEPTTRQGVLKELLGSVISEEQLGSVLKNS